MSELLELSEPNDIDQIITRPGMLQMKENNLFEFVHQTFAEFLVADFIIFCLSQEKIQCSFKGFIELLLEVLLNEKCEGVRKFLNEALKSHEDFNITNIEQISEELHQTFHDTKNRGILKH